MRFIKGTRLDDDGSDIPCFGFEHRGVFIYDPFLSDNGFDVVDPSHYGLNAVQALTLVELNAHSKYLANDHYDV